MRPVEVDHPAGVSRGLLLPQVCTQDARNFTPLLRHGELDGELLCYQARHCLTLSLLQSEAVRVAAACRALKTRSALSAPPATQVIQASPRKLTLQFAGAQRTIYLDCPLAAALIPHLQHAAAAANGARALHSPMAGAIVSVAVAVGQAVAAGDALCVVEAMKMQNVLTADQDGVVEELLMHAGASVASDEVIMRFRAAAS